ncbi:F-box/TPR repeat containing protein pof3 [Blumeria hordei DH14]|uniref:F-box/TPR repeat containing protein pof3 n=1 Tax=Blumeria graminis f. sp. hordei (strain DH14) TaxID=546991 RepID=N1J7M4_BLUG1|nr:F-box/TPR repeat containing protein pof3 [Blumeria hordei DH14]
MVSKNHDPVRLLPSEIVAIVFNNLAMRDKLICLAVSKSWNNFLESTKTVWTTLYISRACQPIKIKALSKYLNRSDFTVHNALLHLESFANKSHMTHLMDTCHGLIDLGIYGKGTFSPSQASVLARATGIQKLCLSQDTQVLRQTMFSMLEYCCKTLKEAKFLHLTDKATSSKPSWPKMNGLTSIHLDITSYCALDLSKLIEATPNIQSAEINNCYPYNTSRLDMTLWPDLERLALTKTSIDYFPKLPSGLKHLILDNSCSFHLDCIDEDDDIFSLPLLETVSLENNNIDISYIFAITESCIRANNLKTLRLGAFDIPYTSDESLCDNFPASSTVEELSLRDLDMLDDNVLTIIELYPSLKKINLSFTLITEVTVKELVDRGVESMIINDCDKVCDEIIKEVREKGVYISHTFMDDTTSSCGEGESDGW